ncbi:MAG TPA: LPS export ABC transporter periplasmic protein LptC [Ancylobacter sp.]
MNRHVEPPVRHDATPAALPSAREAVRGGPVDTAVFKAAKRHSRRVRFLRRALPIGVVVVLGATIAATYIDPLSIAVDLPFELGRLSLAGTKIKMEFPKLHGFTTDNRGYNVTAQSASQDLTQPNQIDLEKIEARLELADKGWANLTANTGRYDTKTEEMVLSDGVRFDTSSGYGGTLKEAQINIKAGRLVSEQPVELNYLDGKLTADRMEVTQKDSRALLTGRVRLDFKMPPPDNKDEPPPNLRGSPSAGSTP